MKAKVIAVLAEEFDAKRLQETSFLTKNGENEIAWIWCEVENLERVLYDAEKAVLSISYFHIDLSNNNVIHHSLLWTDMIRDIQLFYDHTKKSWICWMSDEIVYPNDNFSITNHHAKLYEIYPQNEVWLQYLTFLGPHDQYGAATLIQVNQYQSCYQLLYYKTSPDDVSDVYQAHWCREKFLEEYSDTRLFHCDAIISYAQQEHSLLFVCKRAFHQEPPPGWPRVGSGDWRLGLEVYNVKGVQVAQQYLTEAPLSIRHGENDFLSWLQIGMEATAGPVFGDKREPTCVAALVLHSRSVPWDENDYLSNYDQQLIQNPNGQKFLWEQKGGLFWLDMQGTCFRHEEMPLGVQITLCRSGNIIIGSDLNNGRYRLWKWNPSTTESSFREHIELDPQCLRAMVVAPEIGSERYFWLVEEYQEYGKVSLRESENCQELAVALLDDVTFPLGPRLQHMRDQRKPLGVLAYQKSLLLLLTNRQKQLVLWQISGEEILG